MAFEKIVEALIQEAIQRGEFDNLSNKGQPLDLQAYFDTPEEVRLAYSVLKNAGVLPVEAELLKEISTLKERLAICDQLEERHKLELQIEQRKLDFNLRMERQKRLRRV